MAAQDELTTTYRRANLALRAGTVRDFVRLWAVLDPKRMDETFPGWTLAARTLIERDRARAAGLASAYLKATRMASGVPGDAVIQLAAVAPAAQVESAMTATAKAGLYVALRSGRTLEQASDVALVRASGAAARLVLDGGRETVRRSLAADPRGTGWRRVTSGASCDFCDMLAGRGAVYSPETADFASHDHCACTAEPVYGGDPRTVRAYTPSQRRRSDATRAADNARARAFIAAS